jgi:hypothetical protein
LFATAAQLVGQLATIEAGIINVRHEEWSGPCSRVAATLSAS